ncbi:MAG: flavin reductase family protein [Chloroflexota bacterium]|nr:flavin reductase family protein [Anaerolineales bacterium]MCA9977996.1 flavin reductase family protein [Anaerolineales bacterium]
MSITSEQFRNALRHYPAGVTIVTIKTTTDEKPHGLTVSAFTSLSPEPPLIMVAIDNRGTGHEMMQKEGTVFAVNILPQDKMDLSNRFAWVKDDDRFADGDWGTAVTGAPILNDALAWLDCTMYAQFPAGTHTIYVGHVQASAVPRPDDLPLLYWNRGYRQLKVND